MLKICALQQNYTVGDVSGNAYKVLEGCRDAAARKCNLVVTSELAILGYPPKDLLIRQILIDQEYNALRKIAESISSSIHLLIGVTERTDNGSLSNAVALLNKGNISYVYRKQLLPNYDVFDEERYFVAGQESSVLNISVGEETYRVAITICEDIWGTTDPTKKDPIEQLKNNKVDLLINLSASPFEIGKNKKRLELAKHASTMLDCPVVYVNQVGGNDELIFDGGSFAYYHKHTSPRMCRLFSEDSLVITKEEMRCNPCNRSPWHEKQKEECLVRALVLGVRDYVIKSGFTDVIIGLSGGIDSALVAILACAALGSSHVRCFLMPSPWSSEGSVNDAIDLATRLEIKYDVMNIESLIKQFQTTYESSTSQAMTGVALENLQARIRGTLLMSASNSMRSLLLTTGNKSEIAVGYCTLYGDMNGALAVVGDLYKTTIYKVSEWLECADSRDFRLEHDLPLEVELIGKEILAKEPSAELRPNQTDSQTLPEYEILDQILKSYIYQEEEASNEVRTSDAALKRSILSMVRQSEFKRHQSAPVLKVSQTSFGSGWRYPIVAKWAES